MISVLEDDKSLARSLVGGILEPIFLAKLSVGGIFQIRSLPSTPDSSSPE